MQILFCQSLWGMAARALTLLPSLFLSGAQASFWHAEFEREGRIIRRTRQPSVLVSKRILCFCACMRIGGRLRAVTLSLFISNVSLSGAQASRWQFLERGDWSICRTWQPPDPVRRHFCLSFPASLWCYDTLFISLHVVQVSRWQFLERGEYHI